MTDQQRPAPAAYRDLLARIDRERTQAARTASHAPAGEVGLTAQGIVSGLRIAAAHAVTLFEGRQAGEQWLADNTASAAGPAPATRHVHVTITNPDEYTANRAALSLVDWVRAEFPSHHVTTDAHEWDAADAPTGEPSAADG
ncbi:hypothetical protein ACFVAF_25450 [Streptomyces sp. NPDC057596]|uniref:hypothetical protein n=1 Tax=Streptomyces sp. NPDC057596 TaxID=3346178 RepID=UPI00367D5F28